MATVASLLSRARLRSPGSHSDTDLVSDTELINEISQVQRELMGRWPDRFATRVTVDAPGAGNPWELDNSFTQMQWIFKTDGTRVAFVHATRQNAEDGPAVYFVGPKFYAIGTDPDPSADDLVFICGVVPPDLVAGGSTHSLFPPQFDRMLILKGAIYAAEKDARYTEAERLEAEFGRLLTAFDAQCSEWTRYVRGGADATPYRAFQPERG